MVGSVSKIHDRISNLFYVFSDRATLESIGSMYPGERCSYADRENALAIVRKDVQHFGLQSLSHYPRRVQELYADEIAREV